MQQIQVAYKQSVGGTDIRSGKWGVPRQDKGGNTLTSLTFTGSNPVLTANNIMELSIKQTTALDLLEDTCTSEVLFGGGAG